VLLTPAPPPPPPTTVTFATVTPEGTVQVDVPAVDKTTRFENPAPVTPDRVPPLIVGLVIVGLPEIVPVIVGPVIVGLVSVLFVSVCVSVVPTPAPAVLAVPPAGYTTPDVPLIEIAICSP
jgi:hypothetical protein